MSHRKGKRTRRRFMKDAALVGGAVAASQLGIRRAFAQASPWYAAYPKDISVISGDPLHLCIRTSSTLPLSVHIYRYGIGLQHVDTIPVIDRPEYHGAYGPNSGLLLCAGHDEYWTEEMIDKVVTYVRAGGNVAFLAGDVAFCRAQFLAAEPYVMVTEKDPQDFDSLKPPKDAWWKVGDGDMPENRLIGVSTRDGALDFSGRGLIVQNALSWIYAGSGLAEGATFGLVPLFPVAYYEVDAAYCNVVSGRLKVSQTKPGGTPLNFVVTAHNQPTGNVIYPPREDGKTEPHRVTMGYYTNIGTVVSAATTEWVRTLRKEVPAGPVNCITHNILRGLTRASVVIGADLFSPDARADLVCSNSYTRAVSVWMIGDPVTQIERTEYIERVPSHPWTLVGVGRFHDQSSAYPDLLFANTETGKAAIWFMKPRPQPDGLLIDIERAGEVSGRTAGPGWIVSAAGDLDRDGRDEVVLYHPAGGRVERWVLNHTAATVQSFHELAELQAWGPDAVLAGIADFDGDGFDDLVFYNTAHRHIDVWLMGLSAAGVPFRRDIKRIGTQEPEWPLRTVGHVNTDGRPELVFQENGTGRIVVWLVNTSCVVTGGYEITPHP